MQPKNRPGGLWNIGMSIAMCTAIGIMLGALYENIVVWFFIGAVAGLAVGVCGILYGR